MCCGIAILWGAAVTEELHDAIIKGLQLQQRKQSGNGPIITHQDFLSVGETPVVIGLTYQHSQEKDKHTFLQHCADERIIISNGLDTSIVLDRAAQTVMGLCSPSCTQPLFLVTGDGWCGFVSDSGAAPSNTTAEPIRPGYSQTRSLLLG